MTQAGRRTEPYIGSVRFFKNLILLVIVLVILLTTGLAVWFGVTAWRGQTELSVLADEYESVSQDVAQAQERIRSLEAAMDQRSAAPADSEPLSYQELYPDFYADEVPGEGEIISGVMYLTFDDGPSARTPEVLRILAEKGVKATFFVVGKSDEQSQAWMRQIVEEGHTLGMHTYTHDYRQIYDSVENFLADYYRLFSLIRETTGTTPAIFRFPGGSINSYNTAVYQEIIAEMLRRGFVFYDWHLSTGDAAGQSISASKILSNVLDSSEGRNRGIVLMHDSAGKRTTVEALPALIDGLRAQGFTFDRLTTAVKPVVFSYPG